MRTAQLTAITILGMLERLTNHITKLRMTHEFGIMLHRLSIPKSLAPPSQLGSRCLGTRSPNSSSESVCTKEWLLVRRKSEHQTAFELSQLCVNEIHTLSNHMGARESQVFGRGNRLSFQNINGAGILRANPSRRVGDGPIRRSIERPFFELHNSAPNQGF